MHKARNLVAKNKRTKNSVTFRSSPYAFNLRETGLFERVSSAKIYFLLFLRDTSPSCEIPLTGRINVPVKAKLQHPPGNPPGHLNFLENFCSNPPSPGQRAVQMPHR